MTDVVRECLVATDGRWPSKRECREALAALDAEREANAKEVADLRNQLQICDTHCLNLQDVIRDLRKRIEELTSQLQDER